MCDQWSGCVKAVHSRAAAFHSLVGVAAAATAVAEVLHATSAAAATGAPLDGALVAVAALATFVGGVTATGSVVAFAKLAGLVSSAPLALPGRDAINLALAGSSAGLAAAGAAGAAGGGVDAVAALGGIGAASGLLGAHLTASIGGADMPVVITVLNSYSGRVVRAHLCVLVVFFCFGAPIERAT